MKHLLLLVALVLGTVTTQAQVFPSEKQGLYEILFLDTNSRTKGSEWEMANTSMNYISVNNKTAKFFCKDGSTITLTIFGIDKPKEEGGKILYHVIDKNGKNSIIHVAKKYFADYEGLEGYYLSIFWIDELSTYRYTTR
jgi:hypothetical protein